MPEGKRIVLGLAGKGKVANILGTQFKVHDSGSCLGPWGSPIESQGCSGIKPRAPAPVQSPFQEIGDCGFPGRAQSASLIGAPLHCLPAQPLLLLHKANTGLALGYNIHLADSLCIHSP